MPKWPKQGFLQKDLAKSVDFWVHFRPTSSIFDLLVPKNLTKSFPLMAKDI